MDPGNARPRSVPARNEDYRRNRVADYARYDLPAIAAFVREQSGQIPHWIGHSLGGITLAAALGGEYLGEPAVASRLDSYRSGRDGRRFGGDHGAGRRFRRRCFAHKPEDASGADVSVMNYL